MGKLVSPAFFKMVSKLYKTSNVMLSSKTLVRIYNQMKKDRFKVWLVSDLFTATRKTKKHNSYFNTLIKLGLIEVVSAVYQTGRHYRTSRATRGFRLK